MKGTVMKSLAKALAVVTLATAATAAIAADTPWPSSVPEEYPFSQEFPNVDTYKKEHRDTAATQASMAYPSSAQQEYPLASEFPNMDSYEKEHSNDPVQASNTP